MVLGTVNVVLVTKNAKAHAWYLLACALVLAC
jgi:hypothetical protein